MPAIPGVDSALQSKPLIPVNSNKKPLVRWSDFLVRCPSEAEVSNWISKYPGCSWALMCGRLSGVVVLDYDNVKMYDAAQDTLPSTWIASTPKGIHVYFKAPAECPRRKIRLIEGLDFCGEGGYVLVPNGDSSREWLVSPSEAPLADLPLEILQEAHRQSGASGPSFKQGEPVPALREGEGRNDYMMRRVRSLLGARNKPEVVWNAALGINAQFADPLPHQEVREIFEKSVREHESKHPTDAYVPIGGANAARSEAPAASSAPKIEVPEPRRTGEGRGITISALIDKPVEVIPWLITDVSRHPSIIILAGFAKTGKSILALNLAAAVSVGSPWLDFEVQQGRVLYLDGENPEGDVKDRCQEIMPFYGADTDNILYESTKRKQIHLPTVAGMNEFKTICRYTNPKLVILDSFLSFFPINENESMTVRPAIEEAFEVCMSYGASMLIIDHTTYRTTQAYHGAGYTGQLNPRGSKAKIEVADSILKYEKVLNKDEKFLFWKLYFELRSARDREPLIVNQQGKYVTVSGGTDIAIPVEIVAREVNKYQQIENQDLIRVLVGVTGAHRMTAVRAIAKAVDWKYIVKTGAGNKAVYTPAVGSAGPPEPGPKGEGGGPEQGNLCY